MMIKRNVELNDCADEVAMPDAWERMPFEDDLDYDEEYPYIGDEDASCDEGDDYGCWAEYCAVYPDG